MERPGGRPEADARADVARGSAASSLAKIERELDDATTLVELGEAEDDAATEAEGLAALKTLKAEGERRQLEALLSGEADSNDTYLEVHSGAGGTESCDWARMLLRMYIRWAERRKFEVEVIEETDGDEAGVKSATIVIRGHNAHGWAKTESGVHRLVRISPFDSNARRHTSFASVWVYPVVDDKIEIDVNEGDCRIDTYRASGAGGQHVNKTELRRPHHPHPDRDRGRLPAGALAAQEPRDRLEHAARPPLRARARGARRQGRPRTRPRRPTSAGATRSAPTCCSPTRWSRTCAPAMSSGTPADVLDGDLDPFMEASLAQRLSGRTVAVEDVE